MGGSGGSTPEAGGGLNQTGVIGGGIGGSVREKVTRALAGVVKAREGYSKAGLGSVVIAMA